MGPVGDSMSRYKAIGDYGVIGDMHSAALVGIDGSIDWCCFPRFDSPSVFAAILDADKGGRFSITPIGDYRSEQRYEDETNILLTTFRTDSGVVRLTDFMPCYMRRGELTAFHEIHRGIACLSGVVRLRVVFQPRMNYAMGDTTLEKSGGGYVARNGEERLSLSASMDLGEPRGGVLNSDVTLREGEQAWIVTRYGEDKALPVTKYLSSLKLDKTRRYWTTWVRSLGYNGRWRDKVIRSALVLKLLQYAPSGALVAAVTTSLPEEIGGFRNWDYRYSWIRDAAFSLWALNLIGAKKELVDFTRWVIRLCSLSGANLQSLYGVGCEREIEERELPHLEGYKGSRPVRIGNEAHRQFQLDIYGVAIDAVYFLMKSLGWLDKEIYENIVRCYAEFVVDAWRRPDSGIWEIRGSPRHFVESKVWCYVALDRSIKMAERLGYDEDAERWRQVRKEIKQDIISRGWSEEKKSFVMYYGGDSLDASLLLMPLVRFLPARDPMVTSTIERIREELSRGCLIYRYRTDDGLPGGEGAFLACSFWLINCLIELGRIDEAVSIFEKLLSYANHLGLYSEEVDPETGESLGNFPQAYTHMSLISTAYYLNKALDRAGKEEDSKGAS